jgi:hypothetical protein
MGAMYWSQDIQARVEEYQRRLAAQNKPEEEEVSVDEFDFSTVNDLMRQATLRTRAKRAWQEKEAAAKQELSDNADELRAETDAWLVASLGLSLNEIAEMAFEVEVHNESENLPRLSFRKDGCRFRSFYKKRLVMGSGSSPGDTSGKEFNRDPVYDFELKVEVKAGTGWREIKTLEDLGKLIVAGTL